METFDKRETIGKRAQNIIDEFRSRSLDVDENKEALITEINQRLGDSVEKVLLIKSIIDDLEAKS